jgi:hypothetical protein
VARKCPGGREEFKVSVPVGAPVMDLEALYLVICAKLVVDCFLNPGATIKIIFSKEVLWFNKLLIVKCREGRRDGMVVSEITTSTAAGLAFFPNRSSEIQASLAKVKTKRKNLWSSQIALYI